MNRNLLVLCMTILVGGRSVAQVPNYGDAIIWVHNLGEHVGEEWPVFLADGRTNRLAPLGTRVQLFARATNSNVAFQPVRLLLRPSITTFELYEPGLFDGSIELNSDAGGIAGLKGGEPAEFIVRAWLGTSTWEEALTNTSGFVGHSTIFTNYTFVWRPPPDALLPATITNGHSFTMYPFPQACHLVPFVGSRPLCMDVSANAQSLSFTWAGLGTNYVYTLEFKPSLTATNWTPVPGATWPARTNQFILPNPPAVSSFYRVRAQVIQ
jgi:hypothetical protein